MVRGTIHPLHLNTLAYLFATFVISVYLLIFNRESLKIKSKKGITMGVITGILSSVVADSLVLFGLQTASSINWSILSRLNILVTFTFALILLKEKPKLLKIIAVLVSILGAFLVVYNPGAEFTFQIGNLLFLGAVVAFSLCNITTQLALKYLSVTQLIFIRITSSALILTIITLLFFPFQEISAWLFILFDGIIVILATLLVNIVIKRAGAAFFSIATNLTPVITVFFAMLIVKELPSVSQIAGGSLIIASVFLYLKR
jgi:drug/metabolite transporter (DMT)-like permease